ncbi:MAG: hypothetical protein ACE5K4_09060 [Candidatus Hydrothermarchaeota archaeon]
MGGHRLSDEDMKLVEEFSNCYDVVKNLPKFLYAQYELGDLGEVTEEIGKDLKRHLSEKIDSKEVEKIISESIKEIETRRKVFGLYEVVPYFRRKEIDFLINLHKKALDVSILVVLNAEGIISLPKEKEESIKNKIWLGIELKMYAMLGGIEIPDASTFSNEIIGKISKECVNILYSRIKEDREKYLRHVLSVLDFKQKVALYDLDEDLWRFFVVIEAVRLLDVTGEFVHDLIELSELLMKLEVIEKELP